MGLMLALGIASMAVSMNTAMVNASGLRDIGITDVEVLHPFPVVPMGWVVDVNVTVENFGLRNASFSVVAYYGNSSIGERTSETLDPGQNATLTFSLNTSRFAVCNNFTVWANVTTPDPVMGNNFFNGSFVKIIPFIFGDVNGDGTVNIYDVSTAAAIYGCLEGQPKWNSHADIAQPWGYIDIYDLCTILLKYGTKYKPC